MKRLVTGLRSAGFAVGLVGALAGVVAAGCGNAKAAAPAAPGLAQIKLPPGFKIALYADGVPNARGMSRSPKGILYVGSRSAGQVYAVEDKNGDQRADQVTIVAKGLALPAGVAWRNESLYVSAIDRILRYDGIDGRLANPPAPVVVYDKLPKDHHHGWKFIRFGPDGKLYVPVGAPCNVCNRESSNPQYASIMRMNADGSGLELYASGVRNTVGFDFRPQDGHLWFTDNGRDMLGDDSPPDELNHAAKGGLHFGFPYCHGGDRPDPEFGKARPCSDFVPPAIQLGPHVAALGMRFYTGTMFPAEYRGQIFIAEHGSWNRSQPIGYRVSLVRLAGDRAVSYTTFAEGWLQNGDPWGRPADVEVMPDGALLVADDFAGAIYRISYESR